MSETLDLLTSAFIDRKWHNAEELIKITGLSKPKLYTKITKLGNWYVIEKRPVKRRTEQNKFINIEYKLVKRRFRC